MSSAVAAKAVVEVIRNVHPHWVGDGFPVRSMFGSRSFTPAISPFLMLDYGGPYDFAPAEAPRGVEQHPHRGFETVTIVYDGELAHRDSAGNAGRIGPGDVQWMTAASGVVHEEFHTPEFTSRGGAFEMVQLWVNLPAASKMTPPRYQEITADQIPAVPLPGDAGTARIIAGELSGVGGPARTFTPIHVWNLELAAGGSTTLPVPDGHAAMLLVRRGDVTVGDSKGVGPGELAIFDRAGADITIRSNQGAQALLLAGEPIDDPIVAQGPFVMNIREQIREAIADYQAGRMGQLA